MTHTKGPWNLVWWGNEQFPFPLSILANDDGAWVTRGGEVSSEANARLIAAAPDLLEALKIAQLWLDIDGRYDMQAINAAISKATGAA